MQLTLNVAFHIIMNDHVHSSHVICLTAVWPQITKIITIKKYHSLEAMSKPSINYYLSSS